MSSTADYLDLKAELIAGFPPGTEDFLDFADPDGPGPLLEAISHVLEDRGTAQVEALRAELSPLTCSAAGLSIWEQSCGLSATKIALSGQTEPRRAQVLSRLREKGAPTKDLIRTLLVSFLGYADLTEIVILESDRAKVRAANKKTFTGPVALPATVSFAVRDDPKVSWGNAQVDLALVADLSALSAQLTGPDGTARSLSAIGPAAEAAWLVKQTSGTTKNLYDSFALDSTHIWAVGEGGTILFSAGGGTWSAQASGTTSDLYGVFAAAANDAWAVGAGGTILHWNGTAWSASASGVAVDLYGVFGAAANDVWAVGASGTIRNWNGAAWAGVASGTANFLEAVWGPATNDLWAVGGAGTILHWNGAAWAASASGVAVSLTSVSGSAANHVWAVGSGGTIVKWNGAAWAVQASPTAADLYGVRVVSTTNVWIASNTGQVAFYNGTWSLFQVPGAGALWALAGVGAAPLYVVGLLGGIWALEAGARTVRLYFSGFAGAQIMGTWTLQLNIAAGGILVAADLLVEGLGRYTTWRGDPADGLGAAMYEWGVVVEESKLGATYDLEGALHTIRRLTYARSKGSLIRRSSGAGALPAGEFAAIPDDPGSIPDACIPG